MNTNEIIGSNVRATRARHKLSQGELAEAAGLSIPTISRIESGNHSGRVDQIVNIARALGLNVSDLFRADEVQRAAA